MTRFEEYFNAIGVREPIQRRIAEILTIVKRLQPDAEFLDVGINEYVGKDGSRVFESIRFYSKEVSVLVKDFLSSDYFVISGNTNTLCRIRIKSENYDFIRATEASRLLVIGQFLDEGIAELKGTGENCDYLFDICKKYLIPRLILPH